MNRTKCQDLSDERNRDARVLLDASQWSGAYYMVGYALECALKSCVLAYVERSGIIFDEPKWAGKCRTHDLTLLMELADLTIEREKATGANPKLGIHWLRAKDWREISRYETSTQLQAEQLFAAINDRTDGVLQWVKNFW